MCLATVYKNPENTVVCKNVSRIDVDGEYVLIRDIMGEEIRLQGKIKMVDLANSWTVNDNWLTEPVIL